MAIHLYYLQLINTDVCKETTHGFFLLLLGTVMNPDHSVVHKILRDFVYHMHIRVIPNFHAFSEHYYHFFMFC